MASKKELSKSCMTGQISPAMQSERVSERNTYSEIVGYGIAKPASETEITTLEELRIRIRALGKKTESSAQTEENKLTPRPFFVDTKANVYGVLGGPDKLSEDPWNASVGVMAHGKPDTRLEHFQVERTSTDRAVSQHIGMFLDAISDGRSVRRFWTDTSNLSNISKLLVATAASEYWKVKIKFDPLVSTSQVYLTRKKNESKAQFNARLREFMNCRIKRYHNMLSEALEGVFTHKNRREEALSSAYLIRKAIEDRPNLDQLGRDVKSIPKMIPTVDMLKRIGKLPDVKIKEFSTMFYDNEWNIIKSSSLYTQEEALKKLVKRPISFENVDEFLKALDDIRQSIEEDRLSSKVLAVKKRRLMFSSWWKKDSARNVPMNPLKEVHRRFDDESVRDAFSPFTVLSAADIPLAEEGMSHVLFDKTHKVWYWEEIPDTGGTDPSIVNSTGREMVSYLNS